MSTAIFWGSALLTLVAAKGITTSLSASGKGQGGHSFEAWAKEQDWKSILAG